MSNAAQQSGIVYQIIRKTGRSRIIRGVIFLALAFLPFILVSPRNLRLDNAPLVLVTIIPFGVGVWFIWQGIKSVMSPGVMKTFARYGDPKVIIDQIEAELINGAPTFHMKLRGIVPSVGVSGGGRRYYFTTSWLLIYVKNELEAVPIDEIVWIYRVTVTRNGAVWSQRVTIKDQQGGDVYIGSEDVIFEQLLRHAPWAFVGYTEENKSAWNKDRRAMIRAVAERREHFKRAGAFCSGANAK